MSNTKPKHLILAIESSCDETSLCLLASPNLLNQSNGQNDVPDEDLNLIQNTVILSSVISSQITTHEKYGGVVPEIGARMHAEAIHFIWKQMLQQLDISNLEEMFEEMIVNRSLSLSLDIKQLSTQTKILLLLDKIMVTTTPGLFSALRVGQEFAKSVKFFAEAERSKYKTLSELTPLEIIDINHLRGHIASSFYQR